MSDKKPISARKEVEAQAFAYKLLEHGFDQRAAMQDMKPHLTPESASTEASRLSTIVEQTGAIDSILGGVKTAWQEATNTAIALAHSWLKGSDQQLQSQALKFLTEMGKVVAAGTMPRTAIQNNTLKLPKR